VVSSLKQRQSHASLKMPWALKLPLHLPLSLSLSLAEVFLKIQTLTHTQKTNTLMDTTQLETCCKCK
jgi:hypothetical protein